MACTNNRMSSTQEAVCFSNGDEVIFELVDRGGHIDQPGLIQRLQIEPCGTVKPSFAEIERDGGVNTLLSSTSAVYSYAEQF